MDKKFLNKVVDQIVSETMLNHYIGAVISPVDLTFGSFPPTRLTTHYKIMLLYDSPINFTKHCKDVYGLNISETYYVWDQYRDIIKHEIENGEGIFK